MVEEQQIEMELPYTYSVEEMGAKIAPNTIHLDESFMRDKLKVSIFDGSPDRKKETTNIGCPFCNKGFLKLVSAYHERVSNRSAPTNTQYEYTCSNDECDGIFSGLYRWRRIKID